MTRQTRIKRGMITTKNVTTLLTAIIVGIIVVFVGIIGLIAWGSTDVLVWSWVIVIIVGGAILSSGIFCGTCARNEPDF